MHKKSLKKSNYKESTNFFKKYLGVSIKKEDKEDKDTKKDKEDKEYKEDKKDKEDKNNKDYEENEEEKAKKRETIKKINDTIIVLKPTLKKYIESIDINIDKIDNLLINKTISYSKKKEFIIFKKLLLSILKYLKKYNKKINLVKNLEELDILIKKIDKLKEKIDNILITFKDEEELKPITKDLKKTTSEFLKFIKVLVSMGSLGYVYGFSVAMGEKKGKKF